MDGEALVKGARCEGAGCVLHWDHLCAQL